MKKLLAGIVILLSITAFWSCENDSQETNEPENKTLSLALIGSIKDFAPQEDDHATDMTIEDSIVYTGFWSDGMNDNAAKVRIVDITDILNPVQISKYFTIDWVDDLELVGNNLYIGHYQGFEILDVSNPSSPIFIGANFTTNQEEWPHTECQPFIKNIKILGNVAYVLYWYLETPSKCGFKALNIETMSNPVILSDAPLLIQQSNNEQQQPECVWSGDYVFISLSPNILSVYQVDNDHTFTKISECNTSFNGKMICYGDYLYIGAGGGLSIIDISDKSNLQEILSSSEIGAINGMSVSENYLFLAGETLRVIDLTNKTEIEKIGEYQKAGTTLCSYNSLICYFTDEHDLEILEIE
ncbi:MAG: hypothetical protein KAT68_08165 [Bacteroidales bacterium]|nr:hypothetical protein [Bacteroidales bacterium]